MKIIVADDDRTSRPLAVAAVLSANFILVTSQRDRGQVLEGMRGDRLAAQREQLESLNAELTSLARRDPLTRLGNRRGLQEDLEQLQGTASRWHSALLEPQ